MEDAGSIKVWAEVWAIPIHSVAIFHGCQDDGGHPHILANMQQHRRAKWDMATQIIAQDSCPFTDIHGVEWDRQDKARRLLNQRR